MADVALAAVTKRFKSVTAIDRLSLEIADGELIVLLGPTGAGKTTTLRLVAGLERADEGAVRIGGRDVAWALRGRDEPGRTQAERVGGADVALVGIADVQGVGRGGAEPLQRVLEDASIGLHRAELGRIGDHRQQRREAGVGQDARDIAVEVRHHPEPVAACQAAQRRQALRQRIL